MNAANGVIEPAMADTMPDAHAMPAAMSTANVVMAAHMMHMADAMNVTHRSRRDDRRRWQLNWRSRLLDRRYCQTIQRVRPEQIVDGVRGDQDGAARSSRSNDQSDESQAHVIS